ncbi:MAG: type II secretion system F family protein [Lentisphaeria bacterium]|nr:type II secretion system F family protein [Lentisphaeria bacterium]
MGNMFQLLASVCAALAVTSIFLILGNLFFSLRMERDPEMESEQDNKRIPVLFRLFLPLVSNVYPLIRLPVFQQQLDQTGEQLRMAGYDQVLTAERFLGLRVLLMIFGVVFTVLLFMAQQPAAAVLVILLFMIYPATWLRSVVRKRHLSILKALPNLLDLLTLSVEAGKDFLTALREINARRKNDALNEELTRTLHEIQLGKPRQAALREMSNRVRQGDLTSIVNAIIQADELGVSIGQLLRIQGDQLRVKRFSRAEKLANETPVKILFPVIVFIFPAVFMILMGPIIMQAMRTVFGS